MINQHYDKINKFLGILILIMSYMIVYIEIIVAELVKLRCSIFVNISLGTFILPPHGINDLNSLLKERENLKSRAEGSPYLSLPLGP